MDELSERVMALPVPVPPMLEEACGYTGQARYVALYWGAGDEAYVDDGQMSTTGEWEAYLTFVWHWSVAPSLQGYDLGSSEEEARHWLILDREQRQLSIAEVSVAQRVLRAQWGPASWERMPVISAEDLVRLIQEISSQMKAVNQKQIIAKIREQQQRVAAMQMWLDGFRS